MTMFGGGIVAFIKAERVTDCSLSAPYFPNRRRENLPEDTQEMSHNATRRSGNGTRNHERITGDAEVTIPMLLR